MTGGFGEGNKVSIKIYIFTNTRGSRYLSELRYEVQTYPLVYRVFLYFMSEAPHCVLLTINQQNILFQLHLNTADKNIVLRVHM